MKRKILILSVNIIIILLILLVVEFISFKILQQRDHNFHYKFLDAKIEEKFKNMGMGRGHIKLDNGLGSIIFFGCCTTDGANIKDDKDLISSVFSRRTNRTVYNRAQGGFGLQHMYYQLTNPEFKNIIDVKPDYIIYTIIQDHYRRLFSNSSANEPFYLQYKIKDGKLVRKKDSILNFSLLVYLIKSLYCQHNFDRDVIDTYLVESYKEAKKLWPDVKMVLLNFEGIDEFKDDKVLEENGIQVIDVTKYSDNKRVSELKGEYCADEDCHPSGTYWELVVPGIINEIGMNK